MINILQAQSIRLFLYLLILFSTGFAFIRCDSPAQNETNKLSAFRPDTAYTINYRDQLFDVFETSPPSNESQIAFFLTDAKGKRYKSLGSLEESIRNRGGKLVFATNAGMFSPRHEPVGLYIENGQELKKLDNRQDGKGNFYLLPNGVFFLTQSGESHVMETRRFEQSEQQFQIEQATQSGPMLVIDGQLHPAFNEGSPNRHIRSGVGIISKDRVVFAISREVANFYDFAMLFKEQLGCEQALYLDGAISRMYLPEIGRTDTDGNFGAMIGVWEGIVD